MEDSWRDLAGYALQALIRMKREKYPGGRYVFEIRRNRLPAGFARTAVRAFSSAIRSGNASSGTLFCLRAVASRRKSIYSMPNTTRLKRSTASQDVKQWRNSSSMKEIYYFTAPWCKSCANLKPHIKKVSEQGVTIHEINVEDNPQAAEEYDVMQSPTVILVEDGATVFRKAGFSEGLVVQMYSFAKA